MENEVILLTTEDNPWNPHTDWDEWLAYDIQKGYNTCERLARLTTVSDLLPTNLILESLNESMNYLVSIGTCDKDGKYVAYKLISSKESLN